MERIRIANLIVVVAVLASPGAFAASQPVIETGDVDRFYEVYDAADGHPDAETLQHDYLDPGSDGLHELARLRRVTGQSIADAIGKRPEIYVQARECIEALPRVRERLAGAMRKLGQLYPDARFPPVTIAIGRGKPVGVGGRDTGVQIGAEALCATGWINPDIEDRFVRVIMHEYAHVQQVMSSPEKENETVLAASIQEGAAEFITELTTGAIAYAYMDDLVAGRETAIETAFVDDQDKTDLSDWLYNSTPEKPADLGYWVGYRIVKSFYRHADDKREAIREIFGMTDPKEFLEECGWRPGIQLE